jgi:hypothetical protein
VRLSRSFLTAALLLALLHLYIGLRLVPNLPGGGAVRVVALTVLAASFLIMPLGLMSRSLRHARWAELVAWLAFIAMGYFSSLLVLTLLRDVVLLATSWIWSPSKRQSVETVSAALVGVLSVLITLIGFVNARRRARVVDVDVPVEALPPELHGFCIAQISDVHVGPTIRRPYLDAIVDAVNALEADLIAVTGDLVDGSVQQLAPHV